MGLSKNCFWHGLVCNLLCINIAFRNRGLGSTLIRYGFDIADSEGRIRYVETMDAGYPVFPRARI